MDLYQKTQQEIRSNEKEFVILQGKLERLRAEERKLREELLELKLYIQEEPKDG